MKKDKHLLTCKTIYSCVTCGQEFEDESCVDKKEYDEIMKNEKIKIIKMAGSGCSNCESFYTGASESERNVGPVEKFRQRMQKTAKRSNN